MHHFSKLGFVLASLLFIVACNNESKTDKLQDESDSKISKPRVKVPRINEDSAYYFVKKQTEFGPRVPGSDAHTACKKWLKSTFESYGAKVILQNFDAKLYTGDVLPSSNIIAQFNPDHKDRIILSAHWDSRIIAENDKDLAMRDKPIIGADDGASGVGVLIEIARTIKENPIDLGVDIILWDAEDSGSRGNESTHTWCLGSQYWSKNMHYKDNKAKFGILLDMVGAADAVFYREGYSSQFALPLVNKIWGLAKKMNSSDKFINERTGAITDDHYYVNTIARIPMVDIIHTVNEQTFRARGINHNFGNHWHTHDDNIDIIDKETLRKVAQVVTAVMYKTSDNSL